MKKLLKGIVGFVMALALVALLAWGYMAKRKELAGEKEREKPIAAKSRVSVSEKGEPMIALDDETQKRIALAVEPLVAAHLQPQVTAYGNVVDPAPLVVLDGDLASAEAALETSRAAAERARNLFASGQNVAQKTVESAESQFRLDEIRARSLHRRLALEWGESISQSDAAARQKLLDRLTSGDAAFVRVDVPAGELILKNPDAARVVVLGEKSQPITASAISPAASVDTKTQAQCFLLRIDSPPFPLRPGAAVTAHLGLPGEPQSGVVVPFAAVVRSGAESWAYVKVSGDQFARRAVPLDRPLENGLFVASGFAAGENVVVSGAQALLSEELKSQIEIKAD